MSTPKHSPSGFPVIVVDGKEVTASQLADIVAKGTVLKTDPHRVNGPHHDSRWANGGHTPNRRAAPVDLFPVVTQTLSGRITVRC